MAARRKRVTKKQCSKHGKNLPKRKSHRAASGLGRCSGQARRRKTAKRPNPGRVDPRLTRAGTRVRFAPGAASLALYSSPPRAGELGTTTSLPVGSGRNARRVYLPGPGGGLTYVDWDRHGTMGVSPRDLEVVSAAAPRGRAKKANPKHCPMCGGPAGVLGDLGSVRHWSCRDCGMQFSTRKPTRTKRPKAPKQTKKNPASRIVLWRDGNSMIVVEHGQFKVEHGPWSDYPTLQRNGRLAWDIPERFPVALRQKAKAMLVRWQGRSSLRA